MLVEDFFRNKPHLANILKGMPIDIRNSCTIKDIPSQGIILRKDEEIKYVFLVCLGSLKVINEFDNGYLYSFASIAPRDFVGELEVLAGEDKSACTVKAVTNCTVMQIPKCKFLQWLECDHYFSIMVAKIVAKKMYATSYKNGDISFYTSTYMMTSFIIDYVEEKVLNKERVMINKKRQQIADELGVSVRTVNRIVKKLKEDHLVTVEKGKIYINKEQYSKMCRNIDDYKYG